MRDGEGRSRRRAAERSCFDHRLLWLDVLRDERKALPAAAMSPEVGRRRLLGPGGPLERRAQLVLRGFHNPVLIPAAAGWVADTEPGAKMPCQLLQVCRERGVLRPVAVKGTIDLSQVSDAPIVESPGALFCREEIRAGRPPPPNPRQVSRRRAARGCRASQSLFLIAAQLLKVITKSRSRDRGNHQHFGQKPGCELSAKRVVNERRDISDEHT